MQIINKGGFAGTDGADKEQNLISQRSQIVETTGDLNRIRRVFDERRFAEQRRRRIADDAVNFTDVTVFPGRADIGVPNNFQAILVGGGIKQALEIRRQHPAKIVKGDLFALDSLAANETDRSEMPVGFDGSMNQCGVVVEGIRGEQSGKLTERGRNRSNVSQRKGRDYIV